MRIREYKPADCEQLADLLQKKHFFNSEDIEL